jgi:2-keto-3-deoxy-6-phosphogluconate aldolase
VHKSEVMAKIREVGLVPVLRADSEEEALAIAYALEAGGVTVLEVTMTVPGAVDAIRRLANEAGTASWWARGRCSTRRRRGRACWLGRSLL